MTHKLQPYRFVPQFKHVIWGGTRIGTFKGVDLGGHTHVGESWELSGLPGRESVVADGDEAGMPLPQLIAQHGAALVGTRVFAKHGNRFPLIFKLLDATRDLSVQVHPGDAMARRLHDCAGKSEMWYVIDAEPGARIGAGLNAAYSAAEIAGMVSQHRVMEAMAMFDAHVGDVFDLPAGSIHMLGAGNLVAEVQQASDITYRIWDYDRVDADGAKRELHIERALEAIDRNMVHRKVSVMPLHEGEAPLVERAEFTVRLCDIDGTAMPHKADDECHVLMCLAGEAALRLDDGEPTMVRRGETILIPAACRAISMSGKAQLLNVTV